MPDAAKRPHRPASPALRVLTRNRTGDRFVELSAQGHSGFQSDIPVILDDIASPGRTFLRTFEFVRARDARPPVSMSVDADFEGSACKTPVSAGAAEIISATSIRHPANAVDLSRPLADAICSIPAAHDGK
jgi:ribose-phosphate pyrophosphokinase